MKLRRKRKLGLAFNGELVSTNSLSGHFRKNLPAQTAGNAWEELFLPGYKPDPLDNIISVWRVLAIGIVLLVTVFIVFLRLFQLQVINGEHNKVLADSNRILIKPIHAPRGVIFDKNSKILAENNPGFRLNGKLIDRDQALKLETSRSPDYDQLEIDSVRHYLYEETAAHILGYVSEISALQLKDPAYSRYRIGDRIGQSGIEEQYEKTLRGKDGAEIIEIDAAGYKLSTLRKVEPTPGQNIYLSVDIDLQKISEISLKKAITKAQVCCGAVIVENPKTGEILAMVSLPSFDNNVFTDPTQNSQVNQLITGDSSPMLNRAIGGVYPPGSTFKIVSALAGLASRKISQITQIEDTGIVSIGPYQFANWFFTQYGGKEGSVNIVKALERSNDIFFYRVGEMVGEKVLAETATKMGLGRLTGIDLPGEVSGLIPDDQWKKDNVGEVWYPGDTLHMAIGQGYLLTTPLQILTITQFIANSGTLLVPSLVSKITDSSGQVISETRTIVKVNKAFSDTDINLVKKGLSLVPKEGGTAWPFFSFTVPTAGKTGTAEFGDPDNKTHAWYTSYAPVNDPEIVATVLIEAGGEGSSVAAPVVKDIYTWYFNTDKTNLRSLDSYQSSDSAKILGE